VAEWLIPVVLATTIAGACATATAWWRRRARARPGERRGAAAAGGGGAPRSATAGDARQVDALALATATIEAARVAPHDDARTRIEINLAIAESALRSRRPRNPFADQAGRLRAARTIRIIRTGDDDEAWAELAPLTTSGEFFHLLDCARMVGGEFSAQSLMACAERLWSTRLVRSEEAVRRTWRRADPT